MGVVPELEDAGVPFERRLHGGALDPPPAAVDEPHLVQPQGCRGLDVLPDDGDDVGRGEGMEIELGFDGDADGAIIHLCEDYAATYVTVTTVFMPPRTEKSPTTVIRRGRSASTRSSRIWLVAFS